MSETGAIRDLFVSINLQGNAREAIEKLEKTVDGGIEKLKHFGEVLLGALAIEKLHSFVDEQARLGSEIKDTSDRLGVAVEDLQAFQYAAKQSGSSAEGMARGMQILGRNMNAASEGNAAMAHEFAASGVQIKNADGSMRSISEVMTEVSDAIAKLPPGAARVGLAMKLMGRGGAELIPTLGQGGEEVARLAKEAQLLGGVFGKDYVEAADKADDATERLRFAWRGAKGAVAKELFPSFTDFNNVLSKNVARVKDVVSHTSILRTIMLAVGTLAAIKLVPAFLGLVKSLAGVAQGAGFVSTAFGLLEFAAVIIGVVALIAVFDDLFGMFKGEDSVIGSVLDEMYGFGEAARLVNDLQKAWDELDASLGNVGLSFDKIGEIAAESLGKTFAVMASSFRFFLKLLTAIITGLGKVVEGTAFVGQTLKDLKDGKGVNLEARALKFGKFIQASAGELSDIVTREGNPNAPSVSEHDRAIAIAKAKQAAQVSVEHRTTVNNYGVNGDNVGKKTADAVRDANDDMLNDTAWEAMGIPSADEGID